MISNALWIISTRMRRGFEGYPAKFMALNDTKACPSPLIPPLKGNGTNLVFLFIFSIFSYFCFSGILPVRAHWYCLFFDLLG